MSEAAPLQVRAALTLALALAAPASAQDVAVRAAGTGLARGWAARGDRGSPPLPRVDPSRSALGVDPSQSESIKSTRDPTPSESIDVGIRVDQSQSVSDSESIRPDRLLRSERAARLPATHLVRTSQRCTDGAAGISTTSRVPYLENASEQQGPCRLWFPAFCRLWVAFVLAQGTAKPRTKDFAPALAFVPAPALACSVLLREQGVCRLWGLSAHRAGPRHRPGPRPGTDDSIKSSWILVRVSEFVSVSPRQGEHPGATRCKEAFFSQKRFFFH